LVLLRYGVLSSLLWTEQLRQQCGFAHSSGNTYPSVGNVPDGCGPYYVSNDGLLNGFVILEVRI
jgi:hypothetical protein